MTDPFLAEIRMFSGNFAPKLWALCNGQLMPISQNTALFSLLGVSYGGDGRSTFALPDLRGSVPLQQGSGAGLSTRYLGEIGGAASVTLQNSEMPAHTHFAAARTAAGDSTGPTGAVWAEAAYGRRTEQVYSTGQPTTNLAPLTTAMTGGSEPHNNMPPYLGITFIIALQGVFPQRP